jgi:hypothetical protein
MICVSSNEVYILNPRLDIRTAAHIFAEDTHLHIRPLQATLPGNKLAVRATNRQGEFVAFAYDIPTRRKYPDIELMNLVRSQRILHNLAVRPLPVLRSRGLRTHTADIGKRSPVADRELLEDMMQVDLDGSF